MTLCWIFILLVIFDLKYYVHGTLIYVNENSTAVLRCPFKTDNGSKIDWFGPPADDVYTIGRDVNPNLPHSDRISVVGPIDEREYNLRISNIQQSDKGQYKCVGRLDGSSETGLVELKFAVPPETGPILSRYPLGNIYVGNTISLKCEVSGGLPLANIDWQCDGIFGEHNSSYDTTIESTVNLTIKKSDNNKQCTCIANHLGWTSPETVNISLNVVFAPDTNLTIQRKPAGGITRGNKVNLTCTASGGNPLATLSWNCSGTNTNYTTANTVSHSVEFTVDKSDNNKICTCSATHPVTSYRSTVENRLLVYYEPQTNLSIVQKPPGGIIVGKNVTFTCFVPGGNPLATLSWNCPGIRTNETVEGKASYSLTFTVDKSSINKICTCTANHEITAYKPTVQHNLVVFYAPDDHPSVQQTPSGGIITGHNVTLTCSVKGGNPPAVLKWNCTGEKTNSTTDTTANYSVSFTVNKTHNNATCACSGSHLETSYTPVIEHSLIVYFGPGMPNITSEPIMPWFEGNNTKLNCVFENGNPDATIEWKKENDVVQSIANRHLYEFHNLYKKDNGSTVTCVVYNKYANQSKLVDIIVEYYPDVAVEHAHVNTSEGKNISINCNATGNPVPFVKWISDTNQITGSNKGHSTLSINNIDRNNDSTYTCTAKSTSGRYGNLITNENVSVVVNFAPDVIVDRNLSDVKEGKNVKIQCIANGKPSNYVYWWKHMFRDKVIRTFESNSHILSLENLSFTDFGHYECIVNNGIPDRQGRLNQTNETEIKVKYKPVFMNFHTDITAKVGENVTTAVEFIAFPDINEEIQWTNSTDNSIVVNDTNLFTTLERQTVNTTIHRRNVSFNTFGYRSALVIPKFDIDQAGFYNLQVNNTVGGSNITIKIVVSDLPKPPTQFGSSVIGSTSVTLTWTRGYNGGNKQTFIITYWEITSLDKLSKNITEISNQIAYEEIIQNLLPSTTYVFVIKSTNIEGTSDAANNTVTYQTRGISETTFSIIGPVGGAIGGTFLVILIIMVVVFVVRKQRGKTRRKTDRKNLTFTSGEEDDEDGLKINELYVSAGDDIKPCTRPGDVYAVVDKSNGKKFNGKQNIQETGLYAEVNKRKETPITDPNDESQKKLKTNRKGKASIEKKRHDDVYENIEENKRTIDSTNKNKDGLVYADLVFSNDGKRKFIIRGIENKTEYADVDLSIKVDPLPSDESDKEDEQVTNSMNSSGGV